MDTLKKATKALAATVAAATIICAFCTSGVAAAGNGETVYPDDFTRTLAIDGGITDYAVDGDNLALASKTTIYVLGKDEAGDRKLETVVHESEICDLDYESGNLYVRNTFGNVYLYPDLATPALHEFTQKGQWKIELDDCMYMLDISSGTLSYWKDGKMTTIGDGGYNNMKVYDGEVYVVNGSVPYRLDGAEAIALDMSYVDYSAADSISTGNAAELLKADGYEVKTAVIESGAYYTRIDAETIGEYFTQIQTYKASGEKPCLVLAESGNASIIEMNDGVYITATENLSLRDYSAPANDWAEGTDGRRLANIVEETGIYSSPFMAASTEIARIERGATVTVTEKFALDFIDNVYYRVTCEDADGNSVSGFVAAGFLDEYDYAADKLPGESKPDGEFVYDTDVTTVILALIIVGLVILAIAYLTVVGTKPQAKRNDKDREDK